MRKHLLFIIILIICSCSCIKNVTGDVKKIDLFSKPESALVNLSDLALDIEYIPLQTTKKSLIKFIQKVVIREDRIYIQDNVIEIMCFDKQGKFIYKLDKTGRGPGEYNYLVDFDISSDSKMLAILVSGPNKIMVFNITDTAFSFNNSIKLRGPSPILLDFVPGSYKIMLSTAPWNGNESSLSMVISIFGDTLYFRPNYYKYVKVGNTNFFSKSESIQFNSGYDICFKEEFSDTVFSVSDETKVFLPRFIFDTHGTSFPQRARGDQEYARKIAGKSSQVLKILEVERYLVYNYVYGGLLNKIIYDKSEDKKFEIKNEDSISDNICGGPDFDIIGTTDNRFYTFVESFKIKNYVSRNEFEYTMVKEPGKKEHLKRLTELLKETDNPVLVLITPKK
jgi:hypothetical protein